MKNFVSFEWNFIQVILLTTFLVVVTLVIVAFSVGAVADLMRRRKRKDGK